MSDRRGAVAFVFAFCVLAAQYVVRPVRDAMGIAGAVKDLPRLFLLTLGLTLLCAPIVSTLVTRLPRRRFLPWVYRGIALTLVVAWAVLARPVPPPSAARALFVWSSVWNMFAVSLFWGAMADVFRREEGLRLFGRIGAGGTLGAIVGSLVAAGLTERLGAPALLLVAALLLEGAAWCAKRIARDLEPARPLRRGGALGWAREMAQSPYLLAIAGYLVLFSFTSTIVYFEQARIVKAAVAGTEGRTALFARMDLAVNLLSLALQALAVAPLLRIVGVGCTLAVLPLVTALGSVALRAAPTLEVLVVFQVARRALDYGLSKPAREALFTVVPPDAKYKAKSFIDTFVYRGGDAVAAAIVDAAGPALGAGMVVLALPVCVAWAAVGGGLGRAFRRRDA